MKTLTLLSLLCLLGCNGANTVTGPVERATPVPTQTPVPIFVPTPTPVTASLSGFVRGTDGSGHSVLLGGITITIAGVGAQTDPWGAYEFQRALPTGSVTLRAVHITNEYPQFTANITLLPGANRFDFDMGNSNFGPGRP